MKLIAKFTKILSLSLIIVICTAGNVNAADDVLLNMLPDNCLFCIRINDFNNSLGKLDAYIGGISPIPVSTAMLVNMQLIGITGDPMLNGIDMGGDFAIFGIMNPDKTAAIPVISGFLIPVKSYADFVKNNPNCKPGDNGSTILSAPNSPMGSVILTEAAGGQYALAVSDAQKGTLGILKSAMSAPKPLSAKLNVSQSQNAATAPSWAYVNLGLLYGTWQPEVQKMLEQAQHQISATDKEIAGMVAFAMKMYAEAFKQFAGDADSVTVALTPEPTVLSIDTILRAKDGSELAGMLAADPQAAKGFSMTGYLDNTSAINGLMKLNPTSLQKMYDKMFDIMAAASEDTEFAEQTEKIRTLTKKTMAATGKEAAFSFSYAGGKPPVKLREVVAVRDSAAMKALMNDSIECANLMYQAMGLPATLKYQPGVSTYKGTPIDTIAISIKTSDDPNDPAQAAIKQIYGDNLVYYTAQTQDKFFMTMGSGSQETLKAMLDQPALAATPTGDIKVAMDTLQNTPYTDFVCSVNVINLFKGMEEMLQSMTLPGGEKIPNVFAALKDIQSQSCLVLGGSVTDGQIGMRLSLPKQHLMDIVTATLKIQEQAAAQKKQPQQWPQTPRNSVKTPLPQDPNAPQAPSTAPKAAGPEDLQVWNAASPHRQNQMIRRTG